MSSTIYLVVRVSDGRVILVTPNKSLAKIRRRLIGYETRIESHMVVEN